MRYPGALPGAALCTVVLAACGSQGVSPGEGPNGCVRSPTTLSPSIAPESDSTLTVKAGAFVYVELVEAEEYLSWSVGTQPPRASFPGPLLARRIPASCGAWRSARATVRPPRCSLWCMPSAR